MVTMGTSNCDYDSTHNLHIVQFNSLPNLENTGLMGCEIVCGYIQ